MKIILLAFAGALVLAGAAVAAEETSGGSRPGTADSTGADDAGSGSKPTSSGGAPGNR